VRRLFWTFPAGFAGAGLLVMRLVSGIVLLARCSAALSSPPALAAGVLPLLVTIIPAVLLIAGWWTPIAATVLAGTEVWRSFADPANRLTHILMGTLGAALALLGPGAWSADAHLFGWKRIDIRERRKDRNAP
jgi:hypothetical protein